MLWVALCSIGWTLSICLIERAIFLQKQNKELRGLLIHGKNYSYIAQQEKNTTKPLSQIFEKDIQRLHDKTPIDPALAEKIAKQNQAMREAGRFDLIGHS